MVVAERLRQGLGRFDPCRELGRPAGDKELHLPPMVLHTFAPLVLVFVAAGVHGVVEGLAGLAVAAPEAFGERRKIIRIDGEAGKGGTELEQPAHGVGSGVALQTLLRSVPALVEPSPHRLKRAQAWTRAGFALELVGGIDERLGVARGRKAASDGRQPFVESVERGLRQARPRKQKQRAEPLQTFAGVVHAAVALGRSSKSAVRELELGESNTPQGLAHGRCRIELVAH
jgi:hypothetical protein